MLSVQRQLVSTSRITSGELSKYRNGLVDLAMAPTLGAGDYRRAKFGLTEPFKSQAFAQRFLTTHAAICNAFNIQRHLIGRPNLRRFRAEAASVWAAAVA